jgi:hypothetical protein
MLHIHWGRKFMIIVNAIEVKWWIEKFTVSVFSTKEKSLTLLSLSCTRANWVMEIGLKGILDYNILFLALIVTIPLKQTSNNVHVAKKVYVPWKGSGKHKKNAIDF